MTQQSRRTEWVLWGIQAVLALLFVFAGVMKLVTPVEALTAQVALPGWFLRFIGVAELLGGLGVVLPWLLNIHRELTPIAAGALLLVMFGAAGLGAGTAGLGASLVPLVVALLCGSVAYGRAVGVEVAGRR